MVKDLTIVVLLILDVLILVFLLFLYLRFKKFLNLPWETIEESLDKAQKLVLRLQEFEERKRDSKEEKFDLREEVLFLHQKGLKVKEISKKTGLSEGEIELIIKSKKMGT